MNGIVSAGSGNQQQRVGNTVPVVSTINVSTWELLMLKCLQIKADGLYFGIFQFCLSPKDIWHLYQTAPLSEVLPVPVIPGVHTGLNNWCS